MEHKIDRSGWPKGPWDGEPDREYFISNGFSCLLLRNAVGSWCGYVGVPKEHTLYGKDYDSVENVEVHGGLTFSDGYSAHRSVDDPSMPQDVWWFGFDTAHYGDSSPGLLKFGSLHHKGETYRDQRYTTEETVRLAEQLAKQ